MARTRSPAARLRALPRGHEGRLRAIAALLFGTALGLVACSDGAEPAGPGEACFRALDCRPGLVCVQGSCSAEIDALVPEGAGPPPAPADAGSE